MLITRLDEISPMYILPGKESGGSGSDQSDRDRQDFLFLLLSLLPLQVLYPVLATGSTEKPAIILFLSLLTLFGVWVMRGSRKRFLLVAILALVSLEMLWVSLWPAASSLLPVGFFCILLLLVILTSRFVMLFITTDLSLMDLLPAAASLYLLAGTMLGLGMFLLRGLYPVRDSCMSNLGDLTGSFQAGVAILTLQGPDLPSCDATLPLVRIVSILGMIFGVLLTSLVIGKIGAGFLKKGE